MPDENEMMKDAFKKHRTAVARSLVEGESPLAWHHAVELADDLVSLSSFEAAWSSSRDALLSEDIKQLMLFYDATDLSNLIDQQSDHVKVLQLRLAPYLKEPHPISRVREG
ncbi:hypothetical protein [Pseudomonas sp. ZS1P83]